MGDGGINNDWQAKITLNSVADSEYSNYVAALGERLFGIAPAILKRKACQAVDIIFSSTSLVDFLVFEGLPRGNKLSAGLHMPDWVLNESAYRIACMRGLMDTDGCLYIHVHTVAGKEYQNIGLCFSTYSPLLMDQVGQLFEEFSIIPHITKDGRMLYVYRAEAIARYLDVFGTSNERISSVYRRFGDVA